MLSGAAVAFLEERAHQLGLGCQKVEVSLGPCIGRGGGPGAPPHPVLTTPFLTLFRWHLVVW